MSRRVLFIEHDHRNPPGLLPGSFARHGYDAEQFLVVPESRRDDPGVRVTFPDPRQYDAVVPLGADWSTSDIRLTTWLLPELLLLRAAHQARIPVLGVCFGSQLLALALGGTVGKAARPEIGWHPVEASDPRIEPGPWFQWHYDCWCPPPGARVLARNKTGPQAFSMGTALGVQFHPEVTLTVVKEWLEGGGHEEVTRLGLDAGSLLEQTRLHEETAAARADHLVDGLLGQRCQVRPYATYGG
jgi:GMP synthase-like glutamine amidotransferase